MVIHTLQRPASLEVELDGDAFVEGSAIGATIRARPEHDVVVVGGEVTLTRSVTYRYREGNVYGGIFTVPASSSEVVAREVFHTGGPVRSGQQFGGQVTLQLPTEGALGSVASRLLDVEWTVRARLRVSGLRDVEVVQPVRVLSEAIGQASVMQALPAVVDHGFAAVCFEALDTRRLVPGRSLPGVMSVRALRSGSARAIRLDLVLREHVEHGPWITDDPARNPSAGSKDADTVVATLPLAQHVQLDPRHVLNLPFKLPVPATLPAPSLWTPDITLRWLLRGVVDRHLRADPYVEVELLGVTTPR
jgi:Arrestin (or S-antigen), C-terminal domain